MKLEDIIALTKAGFTKDEIIQFSQQASVSSIAPTPDQPAESTPQPAAAPEPVKEEAPAAPEKDISSVIEQKISEAFKPFENLYNQIAVKANMPTIGNIEPKGIDDIVNDFFTK